MKNHDVLGDVAEFQVKLLEVEVPPPPPPPPPFDMSVVPGDVAEAMHLADELYDPVLSAFKSLVADRQSLLSQHEEITRNAATASTSESRLSLAQSRDRRCAPKLAAYGACLPFPQWLCLLLALHAAAMRQDMCACHVPGRWAATARCCLTTNGCDQKHAQCRVLAKHGAREAHWAAQSVRLGVQFSKKPEDVTLTRAFQFRQRREKVDHIDKSKPVFERVTGSTYWMISLRNSYSQYVPLGNEFTGTQQRCAAIRSASCIGYSVCFDCLDHDCAGLFTEAIVRPPEELTVPLEIFGKPRAFDPARSKMAQSLSLRLGRPGQRLLRTQQEKGRAWIQGAYLQVCSLESLSSTRATAISSLRNLVSVV